MGGSREWTWSRCRERDGIDQSKSYQVQKLDNGSLIPVPSISAPHSLASLRYGLLEKGSPEKRGQCSTYSLRLYPLCPKSREEDGPLRIAEAVCVC